ncbi:Gfo/Idh/MocA family oxidoreductase [Paenibacillus sp. HB172176]|uniref:Gfo/Idh/MocA family oxidoreductase n=1 Tax=Paenibacillus sp. HB172176 TaxID=2493690 RepID=UPI00143AD028|nr:Gfo/Idh/MocA family oxidoreductase [Paenibacillus sp. HB172176]
MKKIGFIDYFLDEWHANNYPAWLEERAKLLGLDWELAYAWAEIDKPDGLSTDDWCAKHNVQRLDSLEELVELSHAIVILSPDHPEHHERLAQLALQSGKPVYMDKTFAPEVAAAKRIFQQAEAGGTPLFSSSALRFAKEIQEQAGKLNAEEISYLAVSGPGRFANYAVHQFEMIVTLMGTGARRLKSLSNDQGRQIIVEFDGERQASYLQLSSAPFQAILQQKDGQGGYIPQCSDMFEGLMEAMLRFFETREVPVPPAETLAVMALIEAGGVALSRRDEWIELP